MSEIHLRHPGFTYSAYGPFTKNKERIQTRHIYQNEPDKSCFQYTWLMENLNV